MVKNLEELKEISPITFTIERIFYILQYISLSNILFGTRVSVQNESDLAEFRKKTIRRCRQVDVYIIILFISEILLFFLITHTNSCFDYVIIGFSIYRIIDIIQSTINLNIFDHLRIESKKHQTANTVRTLVLSIINYFELTICFSLIYIFHHGYLSHYSDKTSALYFSVITQLTIGFGDLFAKDCLRYVVIIHSLFGFVFAILILARLISLIPNITSVLANKSE